MKRLVKAIPRWGTQRVKGETGLDYTVGASGVWMPDRDAAYVVNWEKDVYCARVGGVVRVKPLYIANPTQDEMKRLEEV